MEVARSLLQLAPNVTLWLVVDRQHPTRVHLPQDRLHPVHPALRLRDLTVLHQLHHQWLLPALQLLPPHRL